METVHPDTRGAPAAQTPLLPGLSAFLIVRNEAERLPRTLAALDGLADEIVIVDSGSTDETISIAEAAGARVFRRGWPGYGPQKRFAEDQCRHQWRLNVDADEVVTPALAREIRAALSGPPGAFSIAIRNVYPGDARPRPLVSDYHVVRFYHAEAGRYRDHPLFDRVETSIPVKRLKGEIWHYPFLDWAHLTDKENAYSSFQARTARARPRIWLTARLVTEFPLVFLKFYVLRGHFLGGWKGYVFAVNAAFARFMRVAKLLEARNERR